MLRTIRFHILPLWLGGAPTSTAQPAIAKYIGTANGFTASAAWPTQYEPDPLSGSLPVATMNWAPVWPSITVAEHSRRIRSTSKRCSRFPADCSEGPCSTGLCLGCGRGTAVVFGTARLSGWESGEEWGPRGRVISGARPCARPAWRSGP